ncbi:unnamed protein product [Adineta steineri]|uniref:Uncharacterized protein n=1 Tax=Adineta steineri TaxID=433720 RepID=A0A813SJM3_9BILA|nr:unnamed protein product [Adineta steineri]CAF0969085.1 unnamed protein product [Adineta steineri]CAF3517429.1 unnamed protein product [Adineta steineri]CAF3867713.1 unnamed protein product [Adineta steineri]
MTITYIKLYTPSSSNDTLLKDIERRQDILLKKLEHLFNEISQYGEFQKNNPKEPIQEELVVHLSAKQPSKNILNFIEQNHNKFSIRTYRHSSLHGISFNNPIQNVSSSSNNRLLTIIWNDDKENLPSMFYSNKNLNDEQSILNLLSQQLTNNN